MTHSPEAIAAYPDEQGDSVQYTERMSRVKDMLRTAFDRGREVGAAEADREYKERNDAAQKYGLVATREALSKALWDWGSRPVTEQTTLADLAKPAHETAAEFILASGIIHDELEVYALGIQAGRLTERMG
jgi:hypothetical protein